jgi:hypothetical protein
MGLFDWLSSVFDDADDSFSTTASSNFESVGSNDDTVINPASGLPMIDGYGGVDVAGNAYGFDFSHDSFDTFSSTFTSSFDDWNS